MLYTSFLKNVQLLMHLTQWTDYTLRVLMYCAATEGRSHPVTITEVAQAYGISRSHLMKIVQQLSAQSLLETTRGRGGGMRLMRPAATINVGAVVRVTETDFNLVECFDPATDHCRLSGHCRLKGVLGDALAAYLAVLDGVSLADLVAPTDALDKAQAVRVSAPVSRRSVAGQTALLVPGLPSAVASRL